MRLRRTKASSIFVTEEKKKLEQVRTQYGK